jgi:hypothetical protein
MIECLQLGRLSERTQESYVQAVRLLAEHYHKSPGLITEDELRQYFLYLKNVKLGFADPRQQAMLRAYLSEIEFPQDATSDPGHGDDVAISAGIRSGTASAFANLLAYPCLAEP